MRKASPLWIILAAAACVSPPRPTPAALALEHNARAVVEGRVTDVEGHPVSGLRVDAIPRNGDIPWSPPATTGTDGRFRLELCAPGEYGFALRQGPRGVVTNDPRDPSRVHVSVTPGQHRDGIELLFLGEEWNRSLAGHNNI